jgi:hypothetical protein
MSFNNDGSASVELQSLHLFSGPVRNAFPRSRVSGERLVAGRVVGTPELSSGAAFSVQHLIDGLLLCEVRNHNWHAVPGLSSMAVGQ